MKIYRLRMLSCLLLVSIGAVAQSGPSSDPLAVSLALKAVAAITGGNPITDLSLNTNVISIYGSDYETGTAMFRAKGLSQSRIDLNLSGGTRTDVRNASGGAWQVGTGAVNTYAGHNCLTDSSWFFPGLSVVSQSANTKIILKYIGQGLHGSINTQHIQIFQILAGDPAGILQRLSTEDIYLDANSYLPVAVDFNVHPDNDLNTNISTEILFANYQAVSGIQIPFHFQRVINGSVVLDATVTNAAVNTGLSDTLFVLP